MKVKVIREDNEKTAVLGWGRFNPVTVGHEALVDRMAELASQNNADTFLYLSHTYQDKKKKDARGYYKDPLKYEDKIYFAKKAFGGKVNVVESDMRNIFEILYDLYSKGYKRLIYVGGSDRIGGEGDITNAIKDNNGKVSKKTGEVGYKFDLRFENAGDRNADSDNLVTKASASLARQYAADGDLESFKEIVPLDDSDAEEMYVLVREGLTDGDNLLEEVIYHSDDWSIPDSAIQKCKDFISFVNNSNDSTKSELKKKCIERFGLEKEFRGSLLGCNEFSVYFSENNKSGSVENSKGNINNGGTIVGIARIYSRNNKPFFLTTTYSQARKSIVRLINLTYVKGVSHTTGSKLIYNGENAEGNRLTGNLQSSDVISPVLTPDNFQRLWEDHLKSNVGDMMTRIASNTKSHFDGTYQKNIKSRPQIPQDFEYKLKLNIKSSKEFFDGGGQAQVQDILSSGFSKAMEYYDLFGDRNNKTKASIIECIIKDPSHAEDYASGKLQPITQNGLDDFDAGVAFVDIKYHDGNLTQIEKQDSEQSEVMEEGVENLKSIPITVHTGTKLVNVQKLMNSIISIPEKPFVFFSCGRDKNGNQITNVTSIYDKQNINSYNWSDDLSGAGTRGTLGGKVTIHDNHIDEEYAFNTFMNLFDKI